MSPRREWRDAQTKRIREGATRESHTIAPALFRPTLAIPRLLSVVLAFAGAYLVMSAWSAGLMMMLKHGAELEAMVFAGSVFLVLAALIESVLSAGRARRHARRLGRTIAHACAIGLGSTGLAALALSEPSGPLLVALAIAVELVLWIGLAIAAAAGRVLGPGTVVPRSL